MIYTVTLNPARDRSITIKDFAVGKVNRVSETRDFPGGKGINVSKIITELGGKTTAMGIIGGATGDFIKSSLDKAGIPNDFVFSPNETRTNIKISDSLNHTTTDINDSGAPPTAELVDKVLERLISCIKPGDSVVIAGKTDTSVVRLDMWTEALSKAGAKVFIDTEGEALAAGTAAGPFMLKPNDKELSALLGRSVDAIDDIIRSTIKLVKTNGIRIIIVSLGERGAILVTEDLVLVSLGIKVSEVCTTGAGDSMLGAFTFALDNGYSIKEAFRLSVAAGAAAVMMPGSDCPPSELIKELSLNTEVTEYEI